MHVKGNELVEEGSSWPRSTTEIRSPSKKLAEGELAVAEAQAESTAELEVAQKAIEVSKAEYDANDEIRTRNPGAVSLTELRKFLFQWQQCDGPGESRHDRPARWPS